MFTILTVFSSEIMRKEREKEYLDTISVLSYDNYTHCKKKGSNKKP